MTQERHPQGKVLIIGGGIANFTNVAATFKGIVRALADYQHKIIKDDISIFVRRGGPNYQEGLRVMRELGNKLRLNMHVFGPETHMTAIVGMGLGVRPIPKPRADVAAKTVSLLRVAIESSNVMASVYRCCCYCLFCVAHALLCPPILSVFIHQFHDRTCGVSTLLLSTAIARS